MDPIKAAYIVSLLGAFMVARKLLYGVVIDKIGNYGAVFYVCLSLFTGFVLLRFAAFASFMPYLAVFVFALGSPVTTVGQPLWVADLFGKKHLSRVFSIFRLINMLGAISGALVFGLIYDQSGSYQATYLIFAGCAALLLIIMVYLYKHNVNKDI